MPDQEITATDASGLEDIPPGSHLGLRSGLVIGGAVFLTLFLSYLLTGGGSEIFEPKVTVRTFMADASGLAKNAPVRLNGVAIGKIHSLGLTDSRDPKRVAVIEMKVQSRFLHQIPSDSIAAVSADNLLGDQYIDIQAGRSETPVKAGGEVASLDQNIFNGSDIVLSMEAVLKRVDYLLTQIENGDTRLGRFFHDEMFYESLREQITGIEDAMRHLHTPASEAGKMFFSDELYRRLRDPVAELDEALAAMQRGEGPAGRMLADSSQYDTTQKNLREMRNTLDAWSKAPGMHDAALYEHWLALLNNWGQALDATSRGQGPTGALLANRQLYDSLNGTSKNLRFLFGDIRKNPRKYLRMKVF